MSFDATPYTIQVQGGKSYLTVQGRLAWFRHMHKDHHFEVETSAPSFTRLVDDETIVTVVVTIKIVRPDGTVQIGSSIGSSPFTRTEFDKQTRQLKTVAMYDAPERAATGAVGRALGQLGYGTDDLLEPGRSDGLVDSPAPSRPAPRQAPAAPPPAGEGWVVRQPLQQQAQQQQGQQQIRDPGAPASDKQREFILSLANRAKVPVNQLQAYVRGAYGTSLDQITKGIASDLITLLNDKNFRGLPVTAAAAPEPPDPDYEFAWDDEDR